jgi:hypothetical protein
MKRVQRMATQLWRRLWERRRACRASAERARFWTEVREGEREAAARARR